MDFKLAKNNLNFKVYTAAEVPATGTENDICIISETPMKNWVLSPEAPSGAPRADGDMWIQYAVTGKTFDALKQNALMIATLYAWQYVSGTWTEKNFKVYRNGAWLSLITFIFNAGNVYLGNFTVDSSGYVSLKNGNIVYTYSGYAGGWFCFDEPIDLTPYSKLKMIIKQSEMGGVTTPTVLSVTTSMPDAASSTAVISRSVANIQFTAETNVETEVETSIAGLNGDHYIEFGSRAIGEVIKIWVE